MRLSQGKLYLLNTNDVIELRSSRLNFKHKETGYRKGFYGFYKIDNYNDLSIDLFDLNINFFEMSNKLKSNEVGLMSFVYEGKEVFIGVDTLSYNSRNRINCRYRPVGKQEKRFVDTYAYYLLSTQNIFEHIQ